MKKPKTRAIIVSSDLDAAMVAKAAREERSISAEYRLAVRNHIAQSQAREQGTA